MKIIFILAMLLASSQAHAWPFGIPGMPRCGYHESFDSYGRGLKASFTGEDERPYQLGDKLDEQCYGLGYEKGATVLADARAADLNFGETNCYADFNQGYTHGLKDDASAGSPCFSLGYTAGRADARLAQ